MKRGLRNILDRLLASFGIQTIRKYELEYLQKRYSIAISDLSNVVFDSVIHHKPPKNSNRNSLLCRLYGTQFIEALYLIYYLQKSLNLRGDVCEFGVANGSTSALLANEIKASRKHMWLFDSFQGLSRPGPKDKLIDDIYQLGSMDKYYKAMSYPASEVQKRLIEIDFPTTRTHVVPGYVESTLLSMNVPKEISFAYLDLDLYGPIQASLEFLHKSLTKGGYIVVDDYGFFSTGVKSATDRFIKLHKSEYQLIMPKDYAGKFCIIYRK